MRKAYCWECGRVVVELPDYIQTAQGISNCVCGESTPYNITEGVPLHGHWKPLSIGELLEQEG